MVGIYVKLDAEYATDDKMIEAGPMAELLYVRGLCFAKRTMSDGKISRGQLAAVAIGISSPAKQAQRLVDVGAWQSTRQGWVIAAWLKRNKSAATINAEAEVKRQASALANHERWHVKERKASPTCPLCDPLWETKAIPNRIRPNREWESTETETETETETAAAARQKSLANGKHELAAAAWDLYIGHRIRAHTGPFDNLEGFLVTIRRDRDKHLQALIAAAHQPDATPRSIASQVFSLTSAQLRRAELETRHLVSTNGHRP